MKKKKLYRQIKNKNVCYKGKIRIKNILNRQIKNKQMRFLSKEYYSNVTVLSKILKQQKINVLSSIYGKLFKQNSQESKISVSCFKMLFQEPGKNAQFSRAYLRHTKYGHEHQMQIKQKWQITLASSVLEQQHKNM